MKNLQTRRRKAAFIAATLATLSVACGSDQAEDLDGDLAAALVEHEMQPLLAPPEADAALVAFGQALFFDPELSGNRDIACATCHTTTLASSDALSMAIGTGGRGFGPNRVVGMNRRLVPRNTQDLFNRGDERFTSMLWDGAVEFDEQGTLVGLDDWERPIPVGIDTPLELASIVPLVDLHVMVGQRGDVAVDGRDNELADIFEDETPLIWQAVADRIAAIDAYQPLVTSAFPTLTDELGIQHLAEALAAFIGTAYIANQSPFDDYVAGDIGALTDEEKRGAILFFGAAECASCHSGSLLTDMQFHNLAVPQIGLGQEYEEPLDYGRGRESGVAADRYSFRTPPLRNVEITGPYMHDGAYTNLEAAVRHHLDAQNELENYDPTQLKPELQSTFTNEGLTLSRILSTIDPWADAGLSLSSTEITDLIAFLGALTDPNSRDLSGWQLDQVPSGLDVD